MNLVFPFSFSTQFRVVAEHSVEVQWHPKAIIVVFMQTGALSVFV